MGFEIRSKNWFRRQGLPSTCRGRALTLRLRTVFLFVLQPVAACLRIPVAARRRPEFASILLPEQPPSACSYLAARWQLDVAYTPSATFTRWYMTRLTCGPLLLEACHQSCIPVNILDHLQIPQFRLIAQIRLSVLGAPGKRPLPRLPAATMLADLHRLGWRTELVLQMPREPAQPLGVEIPLALRYTSCEMSHRLESLHWQRMPMLYGACASIFSRPAYRLQRQQVQHLISPERLVFGSAPLRRVAKRPRHFSPFGRLDRSTAAAGTCPPCLMLAPLLLPPPASPGEQPGVRTQRPRIYKQPGTGTQEPCRFCWLFFVWVLVWFPLNSQSWDPSIPEEAVSGPVAVLPSPLGYCLRVSSAMERWLP